MSNSSDDELKDIHGFQAIEIPDWVWYSLTLLIFLIIGYLIYRFFLRNRLKPPISIFDQTILSLKQLDISLNSKSFYLAYSEIVRNYFFARLNLDLAEKTLEEIKPVLEECNDINLNQRAQLIEIFTQADLAKFAKKKIKETQKQSHIEQTLALIEEIEKGMVLEKV